MGLLKGTCCISCSPVCSKQVSSAGKVRFGDEGVNQHPFYLGRTAGCYLCVKGELAVSHCKDTMLAESSQ